MKKFIVVCMILLFANYAFAGPKAQPTSTLDDVGNIAVELGYAYKSFDSTVNYAGMRANRDTYQHNMFWEINAAITKGLQLEYRQRLSESSHKSSWSDGWYTDQHFTGFSNPEFGVRADLVKIIYGEQPFSAVVAYAYTPAKFGSSNQHGIDNGMYTQKASYGFDIHTLDAILGWKNDTVSGYLGYRLESNGSSNSWMFSYFGINSYKFNLGDSHHILLGVEATASKNLTIQADFDLKMVTGMSTIYESIPDFNDSTLNVTANYQVIKDVWLRPTAGFTRYGERAANSTSGSFSVNEAYGFNGGMSVKVLF